VTVQRRRGRDGRAALSRRAVDAARPVLIVIVLLLAGCTTAADRGGAVRQASPDVDAKIETEVEARFEAALAKIDAGADQKSDTRAEGGLLNFAKTTQAVGLFGAPLLIVIVLQVIVLFFVVVLMVVLIKTIVRLHHEFLMEISTRLNVEENGKLTA
jgi:hypothetical protein